jgi:hypothetical protein
MARGRKKGIRITQKVLDEARTKVKNTPKRGRWPKFDNIVEKEDFIRLSKNPSLILKHKEFGTVCFERKAEYEGAKAFLGAIYFRCSSYNNEDAPILDTTCMGNVGVFTHPKVGCQRTSCPYYKKGFIATALKENLFKKEIDVDGKSKHDALKTKKEEEE